mmetsp:Transcript_34684/g.110211  ORF Transcript_34684/g.110211 Transcript_34684/m.110211 type:complete len:346 (+) Transcript_34684:504-1541(+)
MSNVMAGQILVRVRYLCLVPHEHLCLQPQGVCFHILVHSVHAIHGQLHGLLVVGKAEVAQDRWVGLLSQQLAEHQAVAALVPLRLPLHLLHSRVYLGPQEEGLQHPHGHAVLPGGEARVEAPLPPEVREGHGGRHRVGVLERHEALARPLRHDLAARREAAAQHAAQGANARARGQPNPHGARSGEEAPGAGFLARRVDVHERLRGLRLLGRRRRVAGLPGPQPELRGAEAEAAPARHGAARLLQEPPPLPAAGALGPDVVLGARHLREEGQTQDIHGDLLPLGLRGLLERGDAVDAEAAAVPPQAPLDALQELLGGGAHRAPHSHVPLRQVRADHPLPLARRLR